MCKYHECHSNQPSLQFRGPAHRRGVAGGDKACEVFDHPIPFDPIFFARDGALITYNDYMNRFRCWRSADQGPTIRQGHFWSRSQYIEWLANDETIRPWRNTQTQASPNSPCVYPGRCRIMLAG